jgi:hypothetical protein
MSIPIGLASAKENGAGRFGEQGSTEILLNMF